MPKGVIDVIEDYTQRKYAKTDNGYTAELEWTVAYAPDQIVAESAVAVKINDYYPFNSLLTCTSAGITEYNFNLSRYHATYAQLASPLDDKTQPLTQPARAKWSEGSRSIPIDQDVFGNPIVNSAGDAFANLPHIEKPTWYITITRNEPTFNSSSLLAAVGSVNSVAWSPLGLPAVQPGQALCRSILPTSETVRGTKYVPIAYRFELNPGFQQTTGDNPLWDSFLLRVRDQGSVGWYSNSGNFRGRFVDKTKREASNVLLDGTGKPINSSFQTMDLASGSTFPAIANPTPLNSHVSISGSASARTLIYQTRPTLDFNLFMFA